MQALGYPLYINGARHDEPLEISHLPSVSGTSPDGIGGLGAYVSSPIQHGPNRGYSLGRVLPIVRDAKQILGTGDDATPVSAPSSYYSGISPAALAALAVLGIAIRGGCGYVVGRAIAPSADRKTKYAWWGVFAAVVGGTAGLAIEGAVALSHK